MPARPPLHPRHPERICWGCEKYCPASDLCCGNGTIRTPHPVELFGNDWLDWSTDAKADPDSGHGSSEPGAKARGA